jgi:hypothetical protein
MAGVTLDGPVGIRFRVQNVSNFSRDQAKIIELLKQIEPSDGGKKGVWSGALLVGADGTCPPFLADAIWDFQSHWKSKGVFRHIDGVVDPGMNTLKKLNELTPGSGGVVIPAENWVCGPDVTQQIANTWTKVQSDFKALTLRQKINACNTILIPFQFKNDGTGIPTDLDELKAKIRSFADIDGWDTIPLFQGSSEWLRSAPVYDPLTKGPCATPGSKGDLADVWDPKHEDPDTCSNTVQVSDQCWLNGSVNYGTFGVMVRLCSDFARSTFPLNLSPALLTVYSLTWAETLIKAYKKFGANPEGAIVPLAWTQATFNGGVRGVPTIPGNRPKCKCTCGCSGDPGTTTWDYVWKPHKAMGRPTR